MSTITSLASGDNGATSRSTINTNFTNLNADKIETSVIDTDTTLSANSDSKIPSQKAVKAYVDAGGNVNASETVKGIVEEATDAEVTAGTATGGTGAKLFVTPAKLATRLVAFLASYFSIAKNGQTTYDLSTASGTQTIAHGCGVTPKLVEITAVYNDTSAGKMQMANTIYNGTTQSSTYITLDGTAGEVGNTFTIKTQISGNHSQTGVVTFDATNISIAWTKSSTIGGTAYLNWKAIA